MSQVVIENPVINSPFHEPTRHFRFGDEGITNEIVDGRRTSSYFVPRRIGKSPKRGQSNRSTKGDVVLEKGRFTIASRTLPRGEERPNHRWAR